MTIECMREKLSSVYPYPKWQDKVARMHEGQVVAVYRNFQKLDKLKPKKKKPMEKAHQITIWEWMKNEQ